MAFLLLVPTFDGSYGIYWSRSLGMNYTSYAYTLRFQSSSGNGNWELTDEYENR